MRLALLLVLCCACTTRLAAQVVVVNPGIQAAGIDRERIINILLGRVTTWADGTPTIVIVSLEASADHAIDELLGRDTDRLLRGWKRLVYAGAGAMPTTARSNAEAIQLVARLPGAMVLLPLTADAPGCRSVPLAGAKR